MFQQILAILIISFFVSRLFWQKKNKKIGANEFLFWFIFWILAALAVSFLKQIDVLVEKIGFSGQGIDILLYLAVLFLFYLVFRLRLKIEKIDRNITELVRKETLKNSKKDL